jgi:hypothetical protein
MTLANWLSSMTLQGVGFPHLHLKLDNVGVFQSCHNSVEGEQLSFFARGQREFQSDIEGRGGEHRSIERTRQRCLNFGKNQHSEQANILVTFQVRRVQFRGFSLIFLRF